MKKQKKITGQQIKFLINMVSIAIFAISYFYVYTGFIDKTAAAYKEIDTTKQYIAAIDKNISEEDTVRQQTDEINAQIQAIIDSYPVNITKVDNLMFAEQMQEKLGIGLTSIVPSDSSPFYDTILPIRNEDGTEVDQTAINPTVDNTTVTDNTTATADTTNASENDNASTDSQTASLDNLETSITEDAANSDTTADQAGETQNAAVKLQVMTGAQSSVTMNFQTTYQGFKDLLKYINNYPDKTIIDSVSVSADSITGNLTGILVLKRFALTGTGKVYKAPVINDISIGTDNIFGTDTITVNETVSTDGESEIPIDQQDATLTQP